ncbi:MAG: hypothetical protein KatS3mg010_1579 [Acidimicrobiia bacterium]|nr:MAG: hypothetical protein KatS3mg010_1579 [Acidimicrobiia bacterium]
MTTVRGRRASRRRSSSAALWAIVKTHERKPSASPRNRAIPRKARRKTSFARSSGSSTRRARR